MFTRIALFLLSIFAIAPSHVFAVAPKSHALPHFVRILLRPDAAQKLRAPYALKHTSNPDIQSIVLDSTDDITGLLGLSARIHPSRLRPFLPEHSVVFENIREHINPSLFHPKTSVQSVATTDNALLRTSEEKLSRWFTLQFTDSMTPEDAARWCKKSRETIELAEPVYAREICSGPAIFRPNDPMIDTLYALRLMHAFEAWKIVRCDSAIPNGDTMVLADVDLGVDIFHEDLDSAIWHNNGETGLLNGVDKISNGIDDDSDGFIDDWVGWDFAGYFGHGFGHNSPYTEEFHGTHTSGIMAAVGNNGKGIAGVAFGSKIMCLKAASSFSDIVIAGDEGIVYAADHHARVINNSWGGYDRSQAEQDVVDYAYAKGSVVVVATGNNGNIGNKITEFYPASCNHAFSVTSVDSFGRLMDYPCWNEHVAVGAPGEEIVSTVHLNSDHPDRYEAEWGTSMATPQASGALGLILQRFPAYTNRQASERLRATSDSALGDSHIRFRGKGLINIYRAVNDTHAYALRLDSAVVVGPNMDGTLRSGDHADIQLHFTNVLDPLSHPRVSVEFLSDTGIAIQPGIITTTSSPAFNLDSIGTLASPPVQHLAIQVGGNVQPSTRIFGRLWMSDTGLNYTGDYDYFELTVSPTNPGFETLDANNLTVSFDDKGCIGFRDQQFDEQGAGFEWTNAPSSIRLDGKSVLLSGGLIIARDASHAADPFGGFAYSSSAPRDLTPTGAITKSNSTPYGPGQTIHATFSDSLARPSGHVALSIDETDYALVAPAAANTIITHYIFTPRGDTLPFDAGLFMDWDIGQNGLLDTAHYNITDSIFYITRKEPGFPVVGMRIVHPKSGSVSYYGVAYNDPTGAINFPDAGTFVNNFGFDDTTITDSLTWLLFQSNQKIASSDDIAVMLGTKNINFINGEAELTMIMGFGLTQAEVRQSLLNTQAIMEGRTITVKASESAESGLQIWPDPVTNGARIHLEGSSVETKLEVSIWDALGRCVVPMQSLDNGGRIDFSSLPAGIYTTQVSSGGTRFFRTIVKE